MTPTEFVTGLAEAMNVERTELATVDRALAKQGMRQIARGRSRPDITLKEGVQIVCAWAGAQKLTGAANEVERLKGYRPRSIPDDEYEAITRKSKTVASIFGEEENQLYDMNFIEVVVWVTRQLGAKEEAADRIWLAIEKGGVPEITYKPSLSTVRLEFRKFPIKLDWTTRQQGQTPKKNVTITSAVRGAVLKWIFDVTEGA